MLKKDEVKLEFYILFGVVIAITETLLEHFFFGDPASWLNIFKNFFAGAFASWIVINLIDIDKLHEVLKSIAEKAK